MNKQAIIRQLGTFLVLIGLTMLLPLAVALFGGEEDISAFTWSIPITVGCGLIMMAFGARSRASLSIHDGYLLVTLIWLFASVFGCLPYVFSGTMPSVTDSFFETLSGFTATGITVIDNIEAMPNSLLLWRSMTQWLGGLGIIVLLVAIFSGMGTGGMQLAKAELTGPVKEKLRPRFSDSAQSLLIIYVILTILDIAALVFCGMDVFDAVNFGLTTVSTGGYATKSASLGAFSQVGIQWVTIVFMFLSGTSFSLLFRFTTTHDLRALWNNGEWRLYVEIILIFSALISFSLVNSQDYGFLDAIRTAVFTVVSLTSTTGFILEDFDAWTPFVQLLLLFLLFCGGCAGSTSGGVKLERLLIVFRQTKNELMYTLHPRMVTTLRINGNVITNRTIINVCFYLLLYGFIVLVSTMAAAACGLPLMEAFATSLTCLGNGGPSLGAFGPTESFSALPEFLKYWDCALMLAGRLELYTVLVIILPMGYKHRQGSFRTRQFIHR
jgi:trk system potassium uptake protein TrkH